MCGRFGLIVFMKNNAGLTSSWATVATLPSGVSANATYTVGLSGIDIYVANSNVMCRSNGGTTAAYGQIVFALK